MSDTSPKAFVALGANLGDPAAQLREAASRLSRLAPVLARSHLYESAAQGGPAGQPPYLNAVVALAAGDWLGREAALLSELLAIEEELGRVRRERWGPRVIDLDLLDVAGALRHDGVRLPHPRIEERAFVLAPLLDVEPTWRHPLTGRRATDALASVKDGVRRSHEAW
ncbi:MAG: 2-amino-4-hydroxy-6-hydroxymethyldihydropteridine diphosphokinase [Truepera sp.]|jgi:2-amino-4-hydroxy-6-hydroxymethyldihydropteridine diphosphokinase|nr:2-amino-4-hydroxy-6-hydroxymethyldihydropteridine diphosphokinase [Truepera sp.]